MTDEELYKLEKKTIAKGLVLGVFDPTPPAGVSLVEHVTSISLLIADQQMAVHRLVGRLPTVFVAGALVLAYMTAPESIVDLPRANGSYVGKLFRTIDVYCADDEDWKLAPAHGWLLFKRYYEIGGQKIIGNPVGDLRFAGYDEHPLETLARQAT